MNEIELIDGIVKSPFTALTLALAGMFFLWRYMREIQKKSDDVNSELIALLRQDRKDLQDQLEGRLFEQLTKLENLMRN